MESFDIAKVRGAFELTQSEFGELVGVHWTSVAAWEARRAKPREPTRRYIETLIKDRGLEPSQYITDIDDDASSKQGAAAE